MDHYEKRVREYEAQGMTRSDAQAVADAKFPVLKSWNIAYGQGYLKGKAVGKAIGAAEIREKNNDTGN